MIERNHKERIMSLVNSDSCENLELALSLLDEIEEIDDELFSNVARSIVLALNKHPDIEALNRNAVSFFNKHTKKSTKVIRDEHVTK